MQSPARGALRLLRAGALALISVVVAAAAHVAGGGMLPPAGLLAALAAVAMWICVGVTRWRLPSIAVLAILGVSQVAFHEILMILCAVPFVPASGSPGVGGMVAMSHGPGHGAVLPLGAAAQAMPAAAARGFSPLVMTACHVVGTVVLAAVYARGERALWALWAWLAPLVVLLFAPAPTAVEAARGVVGPVVVRRHLRELFVGVPRRGPPALAIG